MQIKLSTAHTRSWETYYTAQRSSMTIKWSSGRSLGVVDTSSTETRRKRHWKKNYPMSILQQLRFINNVADSTNIIEKPRFNGLYQC
jgi:hypothetical protein